jgi:AcrR family transcriptional regulator
MATTHLDRQTARDRLLAAADQLFYNEGVHSVGVDRILAQAGVAKATLYSAFGSKEELIRVYLQRRHERRKARILVALTAYGSPREQLLGVFTTAGELAVESGFRGCAFMNASAESDVGSAVQPVCDANRAWLRGLFAERARAAGADEPERLADQLVLLYDGAVTGARMDRSVQPITTARALASSLLEQRLGPAPRAITTPVA